MKKTLLLVLFAFSFLDGLWAQSDKVRRQQENDRAVQLYERLKKGETLSKEESIALDPFISNLSASDQQTQNRTGGGGTPTTDLVSSGYVFSSSSGTYTAISGGTTLGAATNDDDNFTGVPIGFTFNYDGTDYDTIGVNSNGFIWFGTTAPETNTYTPISTAAPVGSRIVSGLARDLQGIATTGNLQYLTTGSPGSRVFTVQWSNYRSWNSAGDIFNFQIRLLEVNGTIEIQYGSFTKNATARTVQVGLRGTSNTDFNNRTSTTNWAATTAGAVNTALVTLSTTVFPASGLTFRFALPTPFDATPTAVALPVGQLVAGTGYDLTVSVRNNGTSAISAGYNLSYSVDGGAFVTATGVGPALAIGATETYTFTGAQQLISPNEGFPSIRVAVSGVPSDGNPGNDSATFAPRYFFPPETVLREDFNNAAQFTGGTGTGPAGLTISGVDWLTINADGSTAAPNFIIPPAVGALTAFEGQSIANNFNRANGFLIDDYLISPQVSGYTPATDIDSVIFYTRRGSSFADSIDIRLSPGIGVDAGTTASDFSIRVAYIASPNTAYQRVAFKLNDFLPGGTTNYRIALRYLVLNGGPSGANSENFAIDAFSVRRSPIPLTPSIGIAFGSESIVNGSSTPSLLNGTDFESLPVNNGVRSRTFTISNAGLSSLSLTGTPIVQISGPNASDFSVTSQPSGSVASGGATTFSIAFNPTNSGIRTATVSIAHDAPNTSTPYTFAVQGTGVTPTTVTTTPYFNGFESDAIGSIFIGGLTEVNIAGGLIDWSVVQNGTNPTNTPFAGVRQATANTGGSFPGETRRLVFPFFSSAGSSDVARLEFAFFKSTTAGTDQLNVLLSTDGGVNFSLIASVNRLGAVNAWENQSFDLPGTINNEGFQIALEAVSGQVANIFVDNVFVSVPSGPEINVTGNSISIPSGSVTTSTANFTNFGFANTTAARVGNGQSFYSLPMVERGLDEKISTTNGSYSEDNQDNSTAMRVSQKPLETPLINAIPGTVTRTFVISNTGVLSLNISSVTITGANASDFSVTTPPASVVAVSGSTDFQITFNPNSDGAKVATIEIANDDADENPYTFAISGTGISSIPLPYSASFNGSAPGWTVNVVNGAGTNPIFGLVGGASLPDGTTGSAARANFFSATTGRVEVLQSPFLSLAGSSNPVLNFDVAYRSYAGENDRIEVVVSTDGGSTYLVGSPVLYNKSRTSTPSLATLANSTANFIPGATSHWRHETVDLSQFAGQSDLLIGFRATSGFGNNAWIANVTLQDVQNLAVSNVTGNGTFTQLGASVTFTNFGNGGNLFFSNFNGVPPTEASPEFATNSTATTQDGSIFTPNITAPRWWTITYDGQSLAAAVNYSVSLDIIGIPGVNNPNKLYILRRSNRFAPWVALSTTLSVSTLTASGLSGFSDFAIGGDDADNPLPVELSGFTGRNIPTGVELRWNTITETDNAGFDVRRTELGGTEEWLTIASYRQISSLVGKGTTSQAHSYAYSDAGVEVGKSYKYQLRSTDLNGTVHDYPQSVVVEVRTLTPKTYTYKLEQNYPNPFNPTTRIVYQVAATSNVKLEVFDMLGRKVATLVDARKEAGEYPVLFNASELSSGIYFYRLQTDKFSQTRKFMLVK